MISSNWGLGAKSPITKIQIKDNGTGVASSDFKKKILEIGTDVKSGGQGIGRFGSLQIGDKMTIETVAFDASLNEYTKVLFPLDASQITSSLSTVNFEYDVSKLSKKTNTYYKVTIDNIHHDKQDKVQRKNKIVESFLSHNINQAIFEKYPFQIFNREIKIVINGKELDPYEFVIDTPTIKTLDYIDKNGTVHEFKFLFYHIKSSIKKVKVFYCIDNAGMQTVAHEFTYSSDWYTEDLGTWFIYIQSPFFDGDLFRNIDMDGLGHDEVKNLKEFTKDVINDFFKAKNKRFEKFIAELERDKYYPSFDSSNSQSRKLLFQKVAYLVEDEYKLLSKEEGLRGLFYNLIDKALANGYVEEIFTKVIKLSDDSLQKFHSLLEKTNLEDVISFSSAVATKIEFLDFLHELIYGDLSKYLKERSQLHKIVEKELWLFGEAYNGTPHLWSDRKIGKILEELRDKYFNYEVIQGEENFIDIDVEGLENITDLFFMNEKIMDSEDREVMVVELKAPKCAIGKKEIQQIDEYAFTVEQYPGLPKENVLYKFILISSRLTGYAKSKMNAKRETYKQPFLYERKTEKNIEVYIIEWSELIELNKRKLGYLSTKLKVKDRSIKEKFETEYPNIINEKVSSRLTKVPKASGA